MNEATGDVFVKYQDSSGNPHATVVANYSPGNVAHYAGGAPATILNREYYFQVNEAKTEVDFYYKNASGTSFGPIPVASYAPGSVAIFTGAAPATVANQDSWFVVNETTGTLNWYYQTSGGASKGPIVLGAYGASGTWATYTPTFSSSGSASLNFSHGAYLHSGTTVWIQILINYFSSGSPGNVTYTISLPVAAYTGAGSFAQCIAPTSDQPSIITELFHVVASGSSMTIDATTASIGTVNLRLSGVYQSN